MSDVKPNRTAREPGRNGISPREPAPGRTAPVVPAAMVPGATVPEAPTVPEVVSATPEATARLAAGMVSATADPLADSPDDSGSPDDLRSADHPWTIFAEAQGALARGFEAIAVEVAGMTRSGIAAASDAAIALLGARTFSEAVDINAGLARRGVDAVIEGSAKLSDIGVKAVSEASRPMLARLDETRSSALRLIVSHAAAR